MRELIYNIPPIIPFPHKQEPLGLPDYGSEEPDPPQYQGAAGGMLVGNAAAGPGEPLGLPNWEEVFAADLVSNARPAASGAGEPLGLPVWD